MPEAVSTIPTWVPESERDTSYYVFVPKWRCEVNGRQTESLEYVRFHGVPHTGNPTIDRQMRDELVIRMLTINDMVEYMKKGVVIRIKDRADTKKIYDHIQNHLGAMQKRMDSIHNRGLPMEDLTALDELAQKVYEHAVSFFAKQNQGSILGRHLGNRVSRASLFAPRTQARPVGEDNVPPKYPERVGFGELLKEHGRKAGGKATFSRWD